MLLDIFPSHAKSISILAQSVNLEIVKVEFDSTGSQIINSEKYLRNITLSGDCKISDEVRKEADKKLVN